jgi:hypothetical protein
MASFGFGMVAFFRSLQQGSPSPIFRTLDIEGLQTYYSLAFGERMSFFSSLFSLS